MMGEDIDVDNVNEFCKNVPAEEGLLSQMPVKQDEPRKRRRTTRGAKKVPAWLYHNPYIMYLERR